MKITFFKRQTMIIYISNKFKIKTQKKIAIKNRIVSNLKKYNQNYYDIYIYKNNIKSYIFTKIYLKLIIILNK